MHITNSILKLEPGMYILRHPTAGLPPLTVTRAPGALGSNGKMELIATPGTHGSILRDGADCIVMHVSEGPIELLATAYLAHAGATVPALRIDQVGLDAAPDAARKIEIGGRGISIIAHIERSGDVVAGEGSRAGDPSTNLRLEGFQLMWPDHPPGVDLAYSIAVEGIGAMPVVQSGHFCGTRGQARRITEVTFALVGPQAALFALEGSAHFTGGFQVPVTSGMAISGPSGLEHLTALSLRALPAKAAPASAGNPWDESAQTKVFKAKPATATKPAARKKSGASAVNTK